jgi:hypothetical protein
VNWVDFIVFEVVKKEWFFWRVHLEIMVGILRIGGLIQTGILRSARIWLATIRLPNAGPTTGLKSAKSRHYERRLLADFRPVVGPAFGSRMVAKRFCADRVDNFSNQRIKGKRRENYGPRLFKLKKPIGP